MSKIVVRCNIGLAVNGCCMYVNGHFQEGLKGWVYAAFKFAPDEIDTWITMGIS